MNKQSMKFKISISVIKEGNSYIAYAPALDLSSSGKTAGQAKKRFVEAVGIFFEETAKKGTLDEALRSLGWQKMDFGWEPPKIIARQTQSFCVMA